MSKKWMSLLSALVLSALSVLAISGCANHPNNPDQGYQARVPDGGRADNGYQGEAASGL